MVTLVEQGQARGQIVIAAKASPVERHAAGELQKYLEQMSGARLPVTAHPAADRPRILLGSAAPMEGLDLSEQALGYDGFLVRTSGQDLLLVGRQPYSCLYAVYHLLERHLGCGFFQDGDQVPHQATVAMEALDDVQKPRFEWRIVALFHTPAYSGQRWYDERQWLQYFDWAVKKRFNMCEPNWLAAYTGIAAMAAARLGVPVELTEWQRQNLALMRRVFDHARMCGMRFVPEVSFHTPWLGNEPGSMPYCDGEQIREFLRRYEARTGEQPALVDYNWCGLSFPWLDPRDAFTQRFIAACVEATAETLGSDHWWNVNATAEGSFGSGSPEELNRITYSLLMDVVAATRRGDPEARIYTRPPFPYAATYSAQKQAIQDARLPIVADFWLNTPARTPDFKLNDYYWGLPWSSGMIVECGKYTNPWGDLDACLANAQALVNDPRAGNCKGFFVAGESNHRNYLKQELFCDLAWNPAQVERESFLRQYTQRRYGPLAAPYLEGATRAVAATLLSHDNMDMSNKPLYRDWREGYLPGLTASSVKRTMSYLPQLREVLEALLAQDERLADSPLYRFDVVDLGRTYLGAIFNDRLARARKALRARDRADFEAAAAGVEEAMHFMARFVSAEPLFRLKTYDDWARRFPSILPGHDNAESNWGVFTYCQSRTAWSVLLDYNSEDLAELVEHYYWPRVKLYLDEMRKLVQAGQDISGSLGGIPFRISDWAPPQGTLPWSPCGPTAEPELKGGDLDLVERIIAGGTVSGRFDFYEGPVRPLAAELLARFPVPEDLPAILLEPDPTVQALAAQSLDTPVGQTQDGFHTPGVVEQVQVPADLGYVVSVTKRSQTYNLARGMIESFQVDVTDWVKLTRQPDEQSERGPHPVAVFNFETEGRRWMLRYDPGSDETFAALRIDPAGG